MKIVLDTNVLLVSISTKSASHWVMEEFMTGRFVLCFTTDILLEYEEVIARNMGHVQAELFLQLIDTLPNVELITRYFRWDLIETDFDDNKFVDCAIASNARFLVSEDRHFRILQQIKYPRVDVIGIEAFRKELMQSS